MTMQQSSTYWRIIHSCSSLLDDVNTDVLRKKQPMAVEGFSGAISYIQIYIFPKQVKYDLFLKVHS